MPPRWRVREALAHELDLAVSLAMSESLRPLFPSFREAVERLPEAWFAQGRDLLSGLEGDVFTVLGRLASTAGLVEETDYGALTLALREATSADVEAAARRVAAAEGIRLAPVSGPLDTFHALHEALQAGIGNPAQAASEGPRRLRRECEVALAACRDGAAHSRFWYWLDRFQHEVYRPWREARAPFLAAERSRAAAALGGLEGEGVPRLDWLSPKSGLLALSPTHAEVLSGRISVVFHVEPFGLWDTRFAVPGAVLAGFGVPGEVDLAFRARAEDIAARLKALADPTRLTMLRVVRAGEVDNSDVATFLELSHPTISVHAKILRDARLVESRRDGRRLLHRLDGDGVRTLLREVESFLGLRASVGDPPADDPAAPPRDER